MASGPITSWQKNWKMETMTDFIFLGCKITADGNCSGKIKRLLLLGRKKKYDKPRQYIKKQRHHFADKGLYSQSYVFSRSHVRMWELDRKEGWAPKNWCFWTVSAYLRLLIFLPEILIPAFDLSSPAFHMMYFSQKLNKQGDSIQPCCIPFPILSKSVVPRLVLTIATWPAYWFLRRQVRGSGMPIFLRSFHSFLWPTQWKALAMPSVDAAPLAWCASSSPCLIFLACFLHFLISSVIHLFSLSSITLK